MIESIGAVSTDQQTDIQQASIGQQDLFELLLTELTYQDPLKPLDNQEFIARLAQFTVWNKRVRPRKTSTFCCACRPPARPSGYCKGMCRWGKPHRGSTVLL